MSRPSKARIRQSFERAAPTYDSAAAVQRRICSQLAQGLPTTLAPARLLDAGCGTGYAQTLLQQRFPLAQRLALDLSAAMLQRVPTVCSRLAGDMEQLPLPEHSIDLYWSSLSVQWCDLSCVLHEAQRVLTPGGQLAIASLGTATFHELRQAFAGVDSHQHTLPFLSAPAMGEIAASAGLRAIQVIKQPETEFHADFTRLLHAVKAIGANQLGSGRRTGLMSRSAFRQAEAAFENLRTAQGLPLTYDVLYLYGKK